MLQVHKSNRLENLASALAGLLEDPLPSPVMPEWVGVQTQGVGVWLGMEISRRLGIWANVYAPYPRAMIEEIFRLVLEDDCPDTTRFEPGRLTWSIMERLPELLPLPEFTPLSSYLSGDHHGVKRYQLARRIADAFDRYAIYRPDMVLAWESGSDGVDAGLSPDNRWQPILWRELSGLHGAAHVAATAKKCIEVLQGRDACPHGLPPRISLFGVSTLPPLYVNVLAALPRCVSVNLFMLSPSREHWAYIRSRREILREHTKHGADVGGLDDLLAMEEGNRLLASLGRLGRDFQGVLESGTDYLEPGEDLYFDPGETSLLTAIQSDMLNLRMGGGDFPPRRIHVDDDSIRIDVCHSPMREVQVLRDRLQGIFQKCSDIFPHDVIVMVPDIDAYAPFVEAVFGTGVDGAGEIPFSVSDRGAMEESPVIRAFLETLRVLRGRFQVREVLDLLSIDPVREAFSLSEEEVVTVGEWILDAGVRWGVDEDHRESFGQPARRENTWRFGLERLFLGMAMPDFPTAIFEGALPYPGIQGASAEALGKAASFLFGLFDLGDRMAVSQTVSVWRKLLGGVLTRFVHEDARNLHQHRMIRDVLDGLGRVSDVRDLEAPVDLQVVVAWLSDQFAKRPGIQGFISGGVTFCNLLPMRSIPFKVVCLLGLGDGDFPRSMAPDGFDLTAVKTRAGDRSVRNDDRYLFLEAILSAREKLLISYVGRAASDNSVLPPSVVVGELLDAVAEGFRFKEEEHSDILSNLVTEHPLQPFHPSYFDTSHENLFSFSMEMLTGARALTDLRRPPPDFLDGPLGDLEDETITVQDLVRFYRMPVDYLLRRRMGVRLDEALEDSVEREPMTMDALERYGAGEALLSYAAGGGDVRGSAPVMRGTGKFPLGTPGRLALEDLSGEVADILRALEDAGLGGEALEPLPAHVETEHVRLAGKIDRVFRGHGVTARVIGTYGSVNEHRKLSLWIHHLLMNAREAEDGPLYSLLVGRGKKGPATFALGPVPDAGELARDLLSIYRRGMAEPLAFFPKASLAYAGGLFSEGKEDPEGRALEAARKAFYSGIGEFSSEADHPAIVYGFGGRKPLLETGETGFASLAGRIFLPMLRAEISVKEILKGAAP